MAKRNPWKHMVNRMSKQERADAVERLGASDPTAAQRIRATRTKAFLDSMNAADRKANARRKSRKSR